MLLAPTFLLAPPQSPHVSRKPARPSDSDSPALKCFEVSLSPFYMGMMTRLVLTTPRLDVKIVFFCLSRLSRHYLPPVGASGEKDESEVRKSRAVQKGETAHSGHLSGASPCERAAESRTSKTSQGRKTWGTLFGARRARLE